MKQEPVTFYVGKNNSIYEIEVTETKSSETNSSIKFTFTFSVATICYNYSNGEQVLEDVDLKVLRKEFPEWNFIGTAYHYQFTSDNMRNWFKSLERAEKYIEKNRQKLWKIGEIYQCIKDFNICSKNPKDDTNIVKVVNEDDNFYKVICPNHKNFPETQFYVSKEDIHNFKLYNNNEQLQSTPQQKSSRSGSTTVGFGCQRSISPSSKRLIGHPQGADRYEIEVGYGYVSKTCIMVDE